MNNKTKQISNCFYSRPKTIGFIVFLIMLSMIFLVVSLRYKIIKENQVREMANVLKVVEHNFQEILKKSFAATLTLALTINDDGKSENFETVAKRLIDENSGIDALQLVPNGIITKIYPLDENNAAINYDILKSSNNIKKEAEKSIELGIIYFAGPIKLIQGGIVVVGRLPVFKKEKFWGFTAVFN